MNTDTESRRQVLKKHGKFSGLTGMACIVIAVIMHSLSLYFMLGDAVSYVVDPDLYLSSSTKPPPPSLWLPPLLTLLILVVALLAMFFKKDMKIVASAALVSSVGLAAHVIPMWWPSSENTFFDLPTNSFEDIAVLATIFSYLATTLLALLAGNYVLINLAFGKKQT